MFLLVCWRLSKPMYMFMEVTRWRKINTELVFFVTWVSALTWNQHFAVKASLMFHADIKSTLYCFPSAIKMSELGRWRETVKLWSSGYWPVDFCMCLSCIKPLKGAKPVPGPTMMTGVTDLKGRRNWVLRTKIGTRKTSPSVKTNVTKKISIRH